ncbi:triose-phosphate isomerase [Bdellovibrionota bacterium FG-1]
MTKTRGVLIAGNWKMNHTMAETQQFFAKLQTESKSLLGDSARASFKNGSLRAVLLPPMLSLERAQRQVDSMPFLIELGAQNAHWEKKGAFTGEVSGPMLAEMRIHWVLVGHSERRQHFGETDESTRKRTENLLEQGFKVILCIGETHSEREGDQMEAVLTRQLLSVLPERGKGAANYLDGRLVIAYEPVWAIGTGLTATPAQAEEAHAFLRGILAARFGTSASDQTPLLYGGSATPENMDSLLACPNVDGALVGGASLKHEGYLALLASGARALHSIDHQT